MSWVFPGDRVADSPRTLSRRLTTAPETVPDRIFLHASPTLGGFRGGGLSGTPARRSVFIPGLTETHTDRWESYLGQGFAH